MSSEQRNIKRIIFMGTPDFALPTLQALVDSNYEIVAVVTQPDRPKGRRLTVEYSNIKKTALAAGIEVLQPERISKAPWPDTIKQIGCDLIVTCAFGHILPQSILDIPKYGTINVHASLLPEYRGASPMQRAIIDGKKVTGITAMLTDIGMDTGDILLKKEIDILDEDNICTIHDSLSIMGAGLLMDTISLYAKGKIKPIKQDDSKATYAPMIKKEEGLLDFSKDAQHLVNLVRAFNPWPGTYTYYEGKKMKVLEAYAEYNEDITAENGTVLTIDKDSMSVRCGSGILHITKLQFEDRRAMPLCECGHNMICNVVLGE